MVGDRRGGATDPGRRSAARIAWPLADYISALETLPATLRDDLARAWGPPQPHDGTFHFTALRRGKAIVALQPERGEVATRDADYHDTSR
ncbi:cobaltochelatase subunit CobN, partial [uncultured Sphingomonas sp.]|uniref:cobaltochelatase subunit CobN n=1 Tax=uncultured Sphingomonas sp. TaxID=158754 RepID=UPI0035CAD60C